MTSIRLKIAMMAVLVLAAALRLRHIDFGLPALNDPDELMFEMGAIRMLRTGTLNPGWFGHPATTTMYVLALVDLIVFGVGYVTGHFASPTAFADAVFADPTLVILPGRIVMAAFGVLSVWLTMRLADELLDRKVALGAGLVLAVSPLAVTWAQVIRSDIMATSFLLACLIATARHAREPSNSRFVWAAVWLALAVATKWPFALGALPMIAVLLNRWSKGEASFRESLARVAAFGALTLALLLLISPYLVLDHETLWRNLQGEAQAHHLGATGGSPWQNLVWYGQGPVLNGLGLSGSLLAIWGLWLIARHGFAARILLPVLLGFIMVLAAQHLVWDRWALPLLPLMAIALGAAASRVASRVASLGFRAQRLALPVILTGVAAPLAAAALDRTEARAEDTRQAASAWALGNIPPGSTVLIEQFAFDLQAAPWRILFPMGDAGCVDAKAMLAGKIDYATIEAARGSRAIVDYGTLAPERASSCTADYAIIAQYDRYAAESDRFAGELRMYQTLLQQGQERVVLRPQENAPRSGPVVRIISF
ncbi:ArnT family glycosyltransferase [Novosphingobium subterraneum]|nr:glycosyltransferase family 39 protein [Novosphingobium subterraneum]